MPMRQMGLLLAKQAIRRTWTKRSSMITAPHEERLAPPLHAEARRFAHAVERAWRR